MKIEDVLIDYNESVVSVLGNDFITRFLTTGTLSEGFAILSNKRIYFKGKCLSKRNTKFYSSFEERTVDLKDVTGTGFERYNPVGLLIAGLIFLSLGMLPFVIAILFPILFH